MPADHRMQPATAATPLARPIVATVVMQHAEESAMLRHIRSVVVRAPHVGLLHLARLDERIAAHLDGLAVAGAPGTRLCVQALERPGCGEVFALAVRALESHDAKLFDHVLALVPALPEAARGVASALGWVSAGELQGVVRKLLASTATHEKALGLTACRMHQVDPGSLLAQALNEAAPALRIAALRCTAALGRTDLIEAARRAMADDHPEIVFHAAAAACLLGERHSSLRVLTVAALQDASPWAEEALALVLLASPFEQASDLARALSKSAQEQPADVQRRRRLVRAIGLLGDARFVPWLIECMHEPALTRLAGEAFVWITGSDLARQDLETLNAPALPEHPSDDPEDDDIALDEDDSLPWPDVAKIGAWWPTQAVLQAAAQGSGQRLFSGAAPSLAHARQVLREGTQRRRAHAALLACLLEPGSKLFSVAAPATRQRRWLAALP